MNKVIELAGRILLGHIFLLAGINKISGYEGTAGYMEAMGVPGVLLPLVIVLEIVGGLALIIGFKTKWAALALAGFTVLAAVLFHADFSDQTQMILFMKNWAITGGLLMVYVYGAGEISLDRKLGR
ncbi:MAG: DoxX family protein [Gammaproteobacteria bacterium]|jgi:putative oxidoreductase